MPSSIIEQYRQLHEKGIWFKGTAIKGYIGVIGDLIKRTGAKTLLDYGCGKAMFYLERKVHEDWGVPLPYLYDPGFHKVGHTIHREPPPKGMVFDGVICTDVLEHVENPEEVLDELFAYANKFLFLTISCMPSDPKKKLPDGRGVHISIFPPEWWRERIAKRCRGGLVVETRFDVEEIAKKI